jgi:hypothetical protein
LLGKREKAWYSLFLLKSRVLILPAWQSAADAGTKFLKGKIVASFYPPGGPGFREWAYTLDSPLLVRRNLSTHNDIKGRLPRAMGVYIGQASLKLIEREPLMRFMMDSFEANAIPLGGTAKRRSRIGVLARGWDIEPKFHSSLHVFEAGV